MNKGDKKIRIGYHVNATGIGGSDLYLSQIVKNLDREKFEIIFFCKKEYPVQELYGANPDFKIIWFNDGDNLERSNEAATGKHGSNYRSDHSSRYNWKKLIPQGIRLGLGLMKDVEKYMRLLGKYELDIFHSNDGGPEPMLVAARKAGIPAVVASYCVLPDPDSHKRAGDSVRRFFEKRAVQSIDRAIVKTKATRDMWINRLGVPSEKFKIIYNGINPDRFNSQQNKVENRRSLNIDMHTKIVGVTARLHPMKGHRYLIEAIPIITQRIKDIQFWFVGDGDLKNDLIALTKKFHVEKHVRFLGYRTDIDKLTSVYDVAVLPSVTYETFGSSLIEAMSLGIPVVASDFSGIPEVVEDGETGLLVPPGDVQALADAILDILLDNNKSLRMGEAGRIRVKQLFTQERMLKETLDLYAEILHD